MTSPVTWPVSPLQNHSADAVSLGHDTASHTMLNPLLTLQMLVCFIATGACPSLQDKLGSTYPPAPRNLAWETGPPLDAPDPAAPPKPAQWPPYSWQPSPSMTSPVPLAGVTATKPLCRCRQFGARHRKPHHAQPASDFAVEGNNQEVAPVILTMHEVEESSHRIRLHALSSRRWRMISQLVQSVVPVDAYPTKALKRLPTI
ncbi:hypothetical protein HPB51_009416 [Rhipicephalus microplus]|uniref:Uncharacterized protein n=1 Tax=Rhipicephalus microplus TaxID=6941 RepID=A0A9J6EFV2_RHIMP|nr:hypothetical protein HPB51_009416 [Rhipicephalus microplus]